MEKARAIKKILRFLNRIPFISRKKFWNQIPNYLETQIKSNELYI
jgi:hypothetical protein